MAIGVATNPPVHLYQAAEARAVMKKSKAKASRRKRDSDVSRADGGKTSATSVQTSSAGSNPVLAAMGGLSESTEARRCGDEEYEVEAQLACVTSSLLFITVWLFSALSVSKIGRK